jgi:DNA repair ATPase RecN
MSSTNECIDPYINIPKGLNDENLWKAMNQRIVEIDDIRRSFKNQIRIASEREQQKKSPIDIQWLKKVKQQSRELAKERAALHEEMKNVKKRIKKVRRERDGRPAESLATEFMLIAQKKLSRHLFNNIRDEAAINVALYKH